MSSDQELRIVEEEVAVPAKVAGGEAEIDPYASSDSDDNAGGEEEPGDGGNNEPKTVYRVAELWPGTRRYALRLYAVWQYSAKRHFFSYTVALSAPQVRDDPYRN